MYLLFPFPFFFFFIIFLIFWKGCNFTQILKNEQLQIHSHKQNIVTQRSQQWTVFDNSIFQHKGLLISRLWFKLHLWLLRGGNILFVVARSREGVVCAGAGDLGAEAAGAARARDSTSAARRGVQRSPRGHPAGAQERAVPSGRCRATVSAQEPPSLTHHGRT